MVVEYGAMGQPPARQAFAQLLGNARTRLEKRRERILGYLISHGPSERNEFAVQWLTGEQPELAEIISRRQSHDLDLAAILFHRPNQNAVTDDAQGLQDRARPYDQLARFVILSPHLRCQRSIFLRSQGREQ